MRIYRIILLLLPGLFLVPAARCAAGASAPGYAFEVTIQPDPAAVGVFTATLTIEDLASAQSVAAPTVRARIGEPAETTIDDESRRMKTRFTVGVNKDGTAAEYKIEVRDGDTVTSSVHTKIALPR